MPRLSVDLQHSPEGCQRCGTGRLFNPESVTSFHVDASGNTLERWQEHDEQDQREPIIVILCSHCSQRVIEPHPRLYRQLREHEPFPGSMPLCRDCIHRNGVRCEHPDAKANGGNGVELIFPKPSVAFVDGTRGGRRCGWRETWYSGPVQHCAGKEVAP